MNKTVTVSYIEDTAKYLPQLIYSAIKNDTLDKLKKYSEGFNLHSIPRSNLQIIYYDTISQHSKLINIMDLNVLEEMYYYPNFFRHE